MEREIFVLRDGRKFEYLRNGINSDSVIILHAGTMQDLTGWKVWLDRFAAHDISAIAIGRSGYANSSPKPGRITIDIANDVAEIADNLGISKMVNIGLSGGGQHALATGLDPRSVGVVTSGSLAPRAELGDHFFTGMQQADLDEYADALHDINDLVNRFKKWLDPEQLTEALSAEPHPNEAKAQAKESYPIFFNSLFTTMNAGWDWVADDYSSYLNPWGFDPRDITVPVIIWQAGLDLNVPVQHGKWLRENITGSQLVLIDDESHIGMFINYENQIMDHCMELLKAQSNSK